MPNENDKAQDQIKRKRWGASVAKSLKIIDPIPHKGRRREYLARPDDTCSQCGQEMPLTDQHIIHLGLVAYDQDGKCTKGRELVQVTTSDPEQNTVIDGTGNIHALRQENGKRITLRYYPFTYHFRFAGEHKITFTVGKLNESVLVNVDEPHGISS